MHYFNEPYKTVVLTQSQCRQFSDELHKLQYNDEKSTEEKLGDIITMLRMVVDPMHFNPW